MLRSGGENGVRPWVEVLFRKLISGTWQAWQQLGEAKASVRVVSAKPRIVHLETELRGVGGEVARKGLVTEYSRAILVGGGFHGAPNDF